MALNQQRFSVLIPASLHHKLAPSSYSIPLIAPDKNFADGGHQARFTVFVPVFDVEDTPLVVGLRLVRSNSTGRLRPTSLYADNVIDRTVQNTQLPIYGKTT